MLLGIDFGTTRTIAASVDRGNYPIVTFTDPDGDSREFLPSVVALRGDELVYGFDTQGADTHVTRSFKRILAPPDVSVTTTVPVGGRDVPILEVLTGFLSYVKRMLETESSIAQDLARDPIESVAIAVPAHAHSAQRFLTLDAFRRAGFTVAAVVNEPSAAGFEYTHRQGGTLNSKRTHVVVYDLGGGTFDASLLKVDGVAHEIVGTRGDNSLGGDDFDTALARTALRIGEVPMEMVDVGTWDQLLHDARDAKESLAAQTRRLLVPVGDLDVVVPVGAFYEDVRALVDRTVQTMAPLVGGLDDRALAESDIAGIDLVGGASALPLIARVLRERFGRRVHRSPMPAGSTAIGLAIAQDPNSDFRLIDQLSRGIGVFRERDAGRAVAFDPILDPGTLLTAGGPTTVTRRYRAAHNVAWFRFVEVGQLDGDGHPRGDLVPLGELLFPVDPALRDGRPLDDVEVVRTGDGPLIEERYEIDAAGIASVSVRDVETGYERRVGLSLS